MKFIHSSDWHIGGSEIGDGEEVMPDIYILQDA